MKFINIPVDNAEKMVEQHKFLLKEALRAASYHQEQIDALSKAVKDVTFMLTESKQSLPGSDTGSTDAGDTNPVPKPILNHNDDGAPEKVSAPGAVKKDALVEAIKQYEEKHGKFDIDAEVIASFLLTK